MNNSPLSIARSTLATKFVPVFFAAVFIAVLSPLPALCAPITFNTALPVARGHSVFRGEFVRSSSGDDPSGAGKELDATGAVFVLGYGVSPDLAVFAVIPYFDRRLEADQGGVRTSHGADGLGDVTLFGRYTLYRDDRPGRTLRVAPFAGVKVPTGEDDESDSSGRLPQSLQPGSGSWDPIAGVVATFQTLDYQVDSQFSYKATTEAVGFESGDEARLDLSLQYRLWPWKLESGLPGFLYGVLEANLLNQGRNEIFDVKDPDSGGTTLFIVPGLQYVTRVWIIEAGVQLPVVQELNGAALESAYTVHAGFRLNF